MIDIPICVLTCDEYLWMLRPFAYLFNTFWDARQRVRVFGYTRIGKYIDDLPSNFEFISLNDSPYPVENWSDGLIEMTRALKEKWFVLFLEDFWLNSSVKTDVIHKLIQYARNDEKILRMDLTNERISKKHARIIDNVNGIGIVDAPLPSKYSMSFQVGIWNRDLTLRVLRYGETPWQSEIEGTKRINALKEELFVYGSDQRPVEYQPVYRKNKRSLSLDRISPKLINVMKHRGWLDRQG